jgi:hypothetical protein
MMRRVLPVFVALMAMGLFAARTALAEDMTHEGVVVKVEEGKLTMTDKTDKKEHSHDIGKDVKITLDGKTAKLADLKAGYTLKVTTDAKKMVTKVEAMTAKPK